MTCKFISSQYDDKKQRKWSRILKPSLCTENKIYLWLVGWFVVFYATFNNVSVTSWRPLYWWRKPEKTTDMSQVTDKLYHIVLHQVHLAMYGVWALNISGDRHRFQGSCKSNYYTFKNHDDSTLSSSDSIGEYLFACNKTLLRGGCGV